MIYEFIYSNQTILEPPQTIALKTNKGYPFHKHNIFQLFCFKTCINVFLKLVSCNSFNDFAFAKFVCIIDLILSPGNAKNQHALSVINPHKNGINRRCKK